MVEGSSRSAIPVLADLTIFVELESTGVGEDVKNTFERGRSFEEIARRHLVASGWIVLDHNVRFGRREIDLVVRRGATVAFVEVKGRGGADYGHPLEAITHRKRSEIEKVARWWVVRHGGSELEYRFDAVAVLMDAGGRCTVEHVEDAWRLGG